MPFRTEGELICAANAARDLTNLVVAYLNLWRKHANGKNGVTIPNEPYTVVFEPPEEKHLPVTLVSTKTITWSEPQYYDADSDYFVEGYGSGDANISGYTSRSRSEIVEKNLLISYAALLRSPADMEASIRTTAARIDAEKKAAALAREVQETEERLAELRAQQNTEGNR